MQEQTVIQWDVASSDAYIQRSEKLQKAMLEEFLESDAGLLSSADFGYYASETGKSIDWLHAHANYPDGRMIAAINSFDNGDMDQAEQLMHRL